MSNILKLEAKTKEVYTNIFLPASKSISNRCLIIDALTSNKCKLENISKAKDTITLQNILDKLNQGEVEFNVGHAGTTMRFLTAFFCLRDGVQILTGSKRMRERPIKILVDALRSLGANIEYLENDGFPPIKISSNKLTQNKISIDGSISSQYISALMLIAPYIHGGLIINIVGNLVSLPYLQMTENLMTYFGAHINFSSSQITIKNQHYKPRSFFIEGDWSAASYWYSITALSEHAKIKINSLKEISIQGDKKIAEFFKLLGIETIFDKNHVIITKNKSFYLPETIELDLIECPDLAQTIIATCLGLNIVCKLTGLSTLKIKETDRLQALKNESEKLGANVAITNDSIFMKPYNLKPASIKTYQDHRMAMAFAPIALKTENIIIEDPNVVEKSYPNFWKDLEGIVL